MDPGGSSMIRSHFVTASFPTNMSFNMKLFDLMARGHKIYNLSFGVSPFPVPKCVEKALKEFAHVHEYVNVFGVQELRDEIARLHERLEGSALDPARIVVGPGTKQLMFLLLLLFNGEVYLPTPSWPAYLLICNTTGAGMPIPLDTHAKNRWLVTPNELEDAIELRGKAGEHKLFIMTNPGNPSGTCYTEADLQELAKIWRKHKMVVISDEIYAMLKFDGNGNFCPTRKVYPEGTITVTGFSKWGSAGGWRLGYAHFPNELDHFLPAMRDAGAATYSCAAAPLQFAWAKALKESPEELDVYARDCRRILQKCAEYCERELKSVGVDFIPSEAGYYIMPDFKCCRAGLEREGKANGDGMSDILVHKYGLGLMSPTYFFRSNDELFTRLCFNNFVGAPFLAAIQERAAGNADGARVTDDDIRMYCPDLVTAVELLKKFVRDYS